MSETFAGVIPEAELLRWARYAYRSREALCLAREGGAWWPAVTRRELSESEGGAYLLISERLGPVELRDAGTGARLAETDGAELVIRECVRERAGAGR